MKLTVVDLAILGGGCAGLSLARRLSTQPQWQRQTVIIEPRAGYTDDRSWCFWEPREAWLEADLAPLIRHRWLQWRFANDHFNQLHQADNRHYCYLPALRFYDDAISKINTHAAINLWTGTSVIATQPEGKRFNITLSDGSCLLANQIIDTRTPVYTHAKQARLWQIFYGLEIETREAIFNPSRVGLMEHLTATPTATQFLYTLPFSTQHALVELTCFSTQLFSPQDLEPHLLQHINTPHFTIKRIEQACLPMGLRTLARSSSSNYLYAGIPSGALRPATGYAFLRIQRWARELSEQLIAAQPLRGPRYDSALVQAMDTIFLNVLQDKPSLGAAFFQQLAKHVPGPVLVRFLSQEASWSDYLQVIRALPSVRFLIYSFGLQRFFYSNARAT